MATSPPALTVLSGWGAQRRAPCDYVEAELPEGVGRGVDRDAGTIARGLGRSYGDPALNSGGRVVGMARLDRYLAFDEHTGVLTCEAGVSLAQILRDFGPRGWLPLISPGTKFVTVGGCIANDVHGKAHHAQGSFLTSVDRMTVLLASGEIVTASRTENVDLFWASFGGMGLLGIVLTATLRLRRVETTYFRQQAVWAPDLEALFAALEEHEAWPYSVASIDALATGPRLGAGVLTLGDHALRAELPAKFAADPLRSSRPFRLTVPFELPDLTLNPLTARWVNAAILQIQGRAAPFVHVEAFFYPLDFLHHWNRGYGRRGFTQYQFVLPLADGLSRMRRILEAIVASGELPFLNVLKRLGKESGGLLSFPREGWTLAIDFPIRDGTAALLRRLDGLVLDAGGRVYLGKDAFLDAETFRAMYPAVEAWWQVKDRVDPDEVFVSDLGRRVGLVGLRGGGRT